MLNLSAFSAPPSEEVSLCVVDGILHSMNSDYCNISAFTNTVDNHPKIQITRDMLHPIGSTEESRALFLPVHETFFKQVTKVWYEQGFVEALCLIAEQPTTTTLKIFANWTLKFAKAIDNIRNAFGQHNYKANSKSMIAMYSQVKDWPSSLIRFIAWHPNCTKLAIAGSDDSVRIYCNDSTLVPVLKHKQQRNISSIAWRPLSSSEIAIGCENCILIWNVDPNSVVTRPSAANSYILHRLNHCPISSIAWSPHGEYLVSAAAGDSTLYMWDVALDQSCTIKRPGPLGNVFISWTKDGQKLIVSSTGLVFRVWNCLKWTAERWNTSQGYIQSSCWSPCGTILFFATSQEPILFSLCFNTKVIFTKDSTESPRTALPLIDLSRTEVDGCLIGGLVQTMDWDPEGKHLAILFKDTNYIAVFNTVIQPILQITPCCLIKGNLREEPNHISFQKNFKDGSCLTIAWSSGRLQYFPIIYSNYKNYDSSLSMRLDRDTTLKKYPTF